MGSPISSKSGGIGVASFYGNNRTSFEDIKKIRLSHLPPAQVKIRKKLYSDHNEESRPGKRKRTGYSKSTGPKLAEGLRHGIKRPKLAKAAKTKAVKSAEKLTRTWVKNKFDFSRTMYNVSVPKKPQRVELDEETSKKRKFFKTSIHPDEFKKLKTNSSDDSTIIVSDFEDIQETENPFEKINGDVTQLLEDLGGWDEDDTNVVPQKTKQQAEEETATRTPVTSYIKPTEWPTKDSGIDLEFSLDMGVASLAIVEEEKENRAAIADCEEKSISSFTVAHKSDVPTLCSISTPDSMKVCARSTLSVSTQRAFSESAPSVLSPLNSYSSSSKSSTSSASTFSEFSKKYYPIFESHIPTPSFKQRVLSDVSNKAKAPSMTLLKAAAPIDQYQLDIGQTEVGPRECKGCGMVYDVGDAVDRMRHNSYHENPNELKYKQPKNERVAGYCGNDRIILIQDSDSKNKLRKVLDVLKYTENEIGSGYTLGSCWKAFLYVRYEKILGILVAESKLRAKKVIPSDGDIIYMSEETYDVKCGVNRIWVRPEYRQKGIARGLMNCLRKNFFYAYFLKLDDIAFSTTTVDGNNFAKAYTGKADYYTYTGSCTTLDLLEV